MHARRLDRLARLTQGAALVTLGAGVAFACGSPPHVNAPRDRGDVTGFDADAGAKPTGAAADDADAAPTTRIDALDAGGPPPVYPIYTNSAPQQAPPTASAPKTPPHVIVNSPPKKAPPKP